MEKDKKNSQTGRDRDWAGEGCTYEPS